MLIKIWEKKNNENALFSGYLVKAAEEITIINDGDTPTRFIYKIGYDVKLEQANIYSNNNKLVYKFPIGNNKKNFISVSINVKFIKTESPEESTNAKFYFKVNIKERNIEGIKKC